MKNFTCTIVKKPSRASFNIVNGSRRISASVSIFYYHLNRSKEVEDKSKKGGMLRSSTPYPPLCILGLRGKRSEKRSVEKCITMHPSGRCCGLSAIDPLSNAYLTMNIFFWRSNPRSCPFLFPRKWQILDSFHFSLPPFCISHLSIPYILFPRCVKYVYSCVYYALWSSLWNLKFDSLVVVAERNYVYETCCELKIGFWENDHPLLDYFSYHSFILLFLDRNSKCSV